MHMSGMDSEKKLNRLDVIEVLNYFFNSAATSCYVSEPF